MALPAGRAAALPGGQEVLTMPGLLRREPRGEVAGVFSRFDHLFEEWARMMPFRAMSFPRWWEAGDLIRVEEFRRTGPS